MKSKRYLKWHLACHTEEARWEASKTKMRRLINKRKKKEREKDGRR